MSEASAPSPAQPTAAPAPELSGSIEERASAVFSPTGNDNAIANSNGATSPAVDDASRDQERAARRAKLQELQTKTRQSVDAKQLQREREELRKQNETLNAQLAQRIDPTALDEEKFFSMAEAMKLPPQKLFEWLKKRVDAPEEAFIRRQVDPQLAELRKQNEALQAKLDGFLETTSQREQSMAEQQAAAAFTSFVSANASTSPRTARFLEEYGHEKFIEIAGAAAKDLPRDSGPQAVLDEIEESLLAHEAKLQRVFSANPAAPQRQQAPQLRPKNPAAAQAPTHITNSLAQQRSGVVDEAAALENMSLEERAALIFQ